MCGYATEMLCFAATNFSAARVQIATGFVQHALRECHDWPEGECRVNIQLSTTLLLSTIRASQILH